MQTKVAKAKIKQLVCHLTKYFLNHKCLQPAKSILEVHFFQELEKKKKKKHAD